MSNVERPFVKPMPLVLERALFVVAPRDSGKSTHLRSMFQDRRFGTMGRIPPSSQKGRIPVVYHLSNERRLYLRLTSPHEYGDTPKSFADKIKKTAKEGRWCFAGALQPDAFRKMPDVVDSLRAFIGTFSPERVRVAFLSPNRHGETLETFLAKRDLSKELLSIPKVEVLCLDGRKRYSNGLLLADFLDFA